MHVRHSTGFVTFEVPDDFFETATDPMAASMVPVDDENGDECSCTWGSYVNPGVGGTGWDIARYDPDCPEHG